MAAKSTPNACDAAGRTALHYTALSTVNEGRALELAEVLLKYANIDPRDADSEGRSAAEVAEAAGDKGGGKDGDAVPVGAVLLCAVFGLPAL
jgi:hypothetical protein